MPGADNPCVPGKEVIRRNEGTQHVAVRTQNHLNRFYVIGRRHSGQAADLLGLLELHFEVGEESS